MPAYPDVYPRPPIVEAVIALRFVHSEDVLASVEQALGAAYPTRKTLQPNDRSQHPVTQLSSADNLRHLICADGILSVHVLSPYPGWSVFLALAQEAVAVLSRDVRQAGLAGLGVRYLDRIHLPDRFPNFHDYISVMPTCSAMSGHTSSFTSGITTTDSSTQTRESLLVTSISEDDNRWSFVCEVDVFREPHPPLTLEDDKDWITALELLHRRQREIFEASITDRTRELFQ